MTDELIERVGDAIEAFSGEYFSKPYKDHFARAAIDAIQQTHAIVPVEPTEAMIKAGLVRANVPEDDPGEAYWLIGDYKAMIAAAPKVTP